MDSLRVLISDDAPDDCAYASFLLKKFGIRATIGPDTPIIIITAYDYSEIEAEILQKSGAEVVCVRNDRETVDWFCSLKGRNCNWMAIRPQRKSEAPAAPTPAPFLLLL